jgi:hypothetical protein
MRLFIGEKDGEKIEYNVDGLRKHVAILGSSGSGKTVLSKIFIEEAGMQGIPSIVVDLQGDLSSLVLVGELKHDVTRDMIDAFGENEVVIFSPASNVGIPIRANPVNVKKEGLEHEEIVSIISQVSNSICSIIGYNLERDDGKAAQTILYLVLEYCTEKDIEMNSIHDLIDFLNNMDLSVKDKIMSYADEKQLGELVSKLKFLTVGQKGLMFNMGVNLDIDLLLKNNQISILYLNSLSDENEKKFFLSMLFIEIYRWMLVHPSNKLQGILVLDEIAPYIPAGSEKPITKPVLELLFRQARKYGIGIVVATQNPGDIDYKAFAQFGTWCVGRLTTRQDRKKVIGSLKSLGDFDEKTLSGLSTGRFVMFSPDQYDDVFIFNTRWLITEHKTLRDSEIRELMDAGREEYLGKKMKVSEEEIEIKNDEFIRVNIDRLKLDKTIRRNLFPSKEKIEGVDLRWLPLVKVKVRVMHDGLFKTKFEDVDVFIDRKMNIIWFDKGRSRVYAGFGLLEKLNEKQVEIIKCLSRKAMSQYELEVELRDKVTRTLGTLENRGLISHVKKDGVKKYHLLHEIDVPQKLSCIASRGVELESFMQNIENGKILQQDIDVKRIEKQFRTWFNGASFIERERYYLPVYAVGIVGKKRRTILVSGYDGRVM